MYYHLSHDVVTLRCKSRQLLTASLHQVMRSTSYAEPLNGRSAVIGAFRSSMFRREFAPSAIRCCTTLLLCRHPHFGNFNSAVPVDVIRVKSYVDSFLDPMGVPVRVSINKLYLVPQRIMDSLVGMHRNGGGLGMGESYIPIMLFDSLMHRSPCFPDVDFKAFTGNPVNHAILFSRVDSVLRLHQM